VFNSDYLAIAVPTIEMADDSVMNAYTVVKKLHLLAFCASFCSVGAQ
jgi:hypothetical protein